MMRRQLGGLVMVCGIGAIVLGVPAKSSACRIFDCWCHRPAMATTTYTPAYVAAPACAPAPMGCGSCAPCTPCAAAPSCAPACAPQACYRTFYRPAPVMAYMPVTTMSPCTGCATTTYSPVRAWTYSPCLLPYSTYRVSYSNPCVTACPAAPVCGSCSPCSTCPSYGSCPSGACGVASYPASVSGCSTCAGGAMPAPAMTPTPSPSDMSAPPAGSAPPATFVPGAAPMGPGSSTPGATTAPGMMDGGQSLPRTTIQGVPPVNGSSPRPSSTPTSKPDLPSRTASRPVYQTSYFQLLASPPAPRPIYPVGQQVPGSASPAADDGGWRPSHD